MTTVFPSFAVTAKEQRQVTRKASKKEAKKQRQNALDMILQSSKGCPNRTGRLISQIADSIVDCASYKFISKNNIEFHIKCKCIVLHLNKE